MPVITGTSDIAINLQGHYDRNMLQRALPILIWDKFGETRPLPANSGDRINFRRIESLAVNTTSLPEAVTPTGKKIVTTDIYATVQQYGDYITISDWVQTVGLDPNLLSLGGEVLAEQMAESKDILHRDVVLAGTTVRYANGVAGTSSVITAISDDDVASVVQTLEANKCRKIRDMRTGTTKVGTVPIRPCYIAVCHTDLRYDIENLTGFISVEEYSGQDDLSRYKGEINEIGVVKNIRFLATTQGKISADSGYDKGASGLKSTSGTSIDVYKIQVFGKGYYGIIPLQKGSMKNIITLPTDPLKQRTSTGYKFATTTKILNEDMGCRLEVGCTSL